jgi:SAM-dependent methyltransferase
VTRRGQDGSAGFGFDARELFDDDYLHFYAERLDAAASDADAERIWSLASLAAGDRVLDLACGHGRIANRLAARGAEVTGVDLTEAFLERARADATGRGVSVEYLQGDMRALGQLDRRAEFDAVLSWFTSFGYFEDEQNRGVLAAVRESLRPGGRLLLELNHAPGLFRHFLPSSVIRRGEDRILDEHRYDAETGRVCTERTVVRGGRVRSFSYSNRVFAFPELRDWLRSAGFADVRAFGPGGEPLGGADRRMVVRAVR